MPQLLLCILLNSLIETVFDRHIHIHNQNSTDLKAQIVLMSQSKGHTGFLQNRNLSKKVQLAELVCLIT